MVEDPPGKSAIACRVHPRPQHPDAVETLLHEAAARVGRRDDAGRVVRETCHDGDRIARLAETRRRLEQSRLRGTDLRWKVMGEEDNAKIRLGHAHARPMLEARLVRT